MSRSSRLSITAALACAAAFFSSAAAAQTYPSKPLRIVVPLSAGAADTLSRTIAAKLSERWGQPVVVENKPGAGTTIGTDLVAKAPADGHTLLMATFSHAVNATFYRKLPFDPVKDFAAVTLVASAPNILSVHPGVPAKNVGQLIALVKAQPGRLHFGSAGNGSSSHLAGELFKSLSGVDLVHVPYKGAAPAMNDLLGGRVQMTFDPLPSALSHIKAGKLRPLAVTTTTRSGVLPGVPTMSEAGVPGYELNGWSGILVHADTPKDIVRKLHAEIVSIIKAPDIATRFNALGFDIVGNTPEAFQAFIDAEIVKWGKVVRAANVHAD
ncbi:MAG TPA: tripartite tricarboxylate transporter substrate binding protein [Burkholderiales bacterium]